MIRATILITALLLTAGCGRQAESATCPSARDLAPSSVPAGYLDDLTARLAGPDRENSISEAVARMHRTAPQLTASEVTDILIAADCPNTSTSDDDVASMRARIAEFRGQVDVLMGNSIAE